jgi:membrane-anchored glycerophosphoryl diester phosphodiesterase (GDPDase)
MENNVLSLLQDYRKNTKPVRQLLGDPEEIKQAKVAEDIFISRLKSTRARSFRLVITIIAVLIIIIVFLGVLIWKHNDNQTYVLALLGGQGAGVFLAVNMMLRLKREEFFASIIVDLLPKATTKEDKDKLIDTLIQYLKG